MSRQRHTKSDSRPVYLNLFRIGMPPMAVVSILHRITGVVLFLALPAVVALFDLSLRDPAGFAAVREVMASPWLGGLAGLLLAAYGYHLVAGVRFLMLDLGIGVSRRAAVRVAWVVLGLGAAMLIAGLLWAVGA